MFDITNSSNEGIELNLCKFIYSPLQLYKYIRQLDFSEFRRATSNTAPRILGAIAGKPLKTEIQNYEFAYFVEESRRVSLG